MSGDIPEGYEVRVFCCDAYIHTFHGAFKWLTPENGRLEICHPEQGTMAEFAAGQWMAVVPRPERVKEGD